MSKTDDLLGKLLQRINAAPPAKGAAVECGFIGKMDDITRQSHVRVIKSLVRAYRQFGFQLLVDQATVGVAGIDDLSDDDLIALHRDLERGRECLADGITFDEAGLIRSRYA